jgi:hypothetical protein
MHKHKQITNISEPKKWLIISCQHNDLMDGAYGQRIDTVEGTYDEACIRAREYIGNCSPVGVLGVIE